MRSKAADSLERLAEEESWNPEAWEECYSLVEANRTDELLRYVFDDLIHYSGAFTPRNILGLPKRPDQQEIQYYRQEFRDIASALRAYMPLNQAKKKYGL